MEHKGENSCAARGRVKNNEWVQKPLENPYPRGKTERIPEEGEPAKFGPRCESPNRREKDRRVQPNSRWDQEGGDKLRKRGEKRSK